MKLQEAIAHSLGYLRSDAARASIARDPYWPKWDSPWWHVLALREAGVEPPREAVHALVEASEKHYLPFFPRAPEVLPHGKSSRTDVMCFCALSSLMLTAHRVNAADRTPSSTTTSKRAWATISWADDFIRRYQLPDGGWNCDEQSSVSSIVSTVPVLEYLLERPGFEDSVDRGMQYLIERRLFRSRTTGKTLDEAWLVPSFPRFYEYDVLRGLRLLARWPGDVPRDAVADALSVASDAVRCWPLSDAARRSDGVESSFPLLEALARPEVARPILEAEWKWVRRRLG